MAFNPFTIIKSLLIKESGTLTPKQIEIVPGGSASTKTTITSSQTVGQTITLPNATDTLVGKNTVDTLANKTLDNSSVITVKDTNLTIQDDIDPTKQVKFQASGLTTATTQTLTVPNATGSLVLDTAAQTLSSKTIVVANNTITTVAIGNLTSTELNAALSELQTDVDTRSTSAALTSHTGASSGVHGVTGAVVGTTDAQALTNKSLIDVNTSVVDSVDATKKILFDAAGTTATSTTLTSSQTVNRILTLPDASDTLVGRSTTDTLTNKTLSSPTITTPTGLVKNDVGLGLADNTSDATKNAAAVTLTNKSLVDASTSIVDSVDATKRILFDAAGTTSTATTLLSSQTVNRTLTLPDATDTLVGRSTTDTLTNKTLASPAITTPTGLVKADVGLGLVDNTSDATKNTAVATLSNKTLAEPLTDIITFQQAIGLPGTPAAGKYKAYVKATSGKLAILDPAGVETEVGSGSGGSVNFITNGKAETGTTGLNTYVSVQGFPTSAVDTATDTITVTGHGLTNGLRVQFTNSGGALPAGLSLLTDYYVRDAATNTFKVSATNGGTAVDITTQGTGVHGVRPSRPVALAGTSSAFVWSTSAVAPLEGTDSFLITMTNNNMGDGGRIAFDIDAAYKAKVLTISFDMMLSSGTYSNGTSTTDSELIYGIYDVTNGVFIQPSNYKIDALNTNLSERYQAEFQAASNSTSYQLYFHSAYGTNSYVAKVDNIAVSPNSYVFGSPVTDMPTYTPTTAGFGTISMSHLNVYKSGSRLIGECRFTPGTTTAVTTSFSLPPGLSISTTVASQAIIGSGSNQAGLDFVVLGASGGTTISFGDAEASALSSVLGTAFTSSSPISFQFSVPIQGWASSVQMSDQTSTRIVEAKYRFTSAFTSSPTIPFNFGTKVTDTHSAVTTSATAWRFTAPCPGKYLVTVCHAAGAIGVSTYLWKNGVQGDFFFTSPFSAGNGAINGSIEIELNANDYIDVRLDSSNSVSSGYISIFRISGSSQIAASEKIKVKYRATSAAGMGTGSTTNPFTYGTKDEDSHGLWNGTRFTAQRADTYRVSACFVDPGAAAYISVYKNGAISDPLCTVTAATNPQSGSTNIYLLAGEYIDIRPNLSTGINATALATYNHIAIESV